MNITRIYTDENGDLRFEDITVGLTDRGAIRFLSEKVNVSKKQVFKDSSGLQLYAIAGFGTGALIITSTIKYTSFSVL